MKRFFCLAIALMIALPAYAQVKGDSFVYEVSKVTIVHQMTGEVKPLPAQPEQQKVITAPQPKKPKVEPRKTVFDVVVRPDKAFYTQDMFINPELDKTKGMLIYYDKPATNPYLPENLMAMVDVVFMDELGNIVQIMPNVNLRTLEKVPPTPKPVIAVLLIQEGLTEAYDIQPGDAAEHDIFLSKPPIVIQ